MIFFYEIVFYILSDYDIILLYYIIKELTVMISAILENTASQVSTVVSTAEESGVETFEQNISKAQEWLMNGYNWFMGYLPNIIAAILILVVGFWATKIVGKIVLKAMTKGKADPTVSTFLHSLVGVTLKLVIVICVLSTLGIDMTTIITTVGAAAVTIGLALKDSLSNVASGTLIILNKKFKIGDYLETEGLKGKVKKIDMMYTTLCTYDNKEILIPNSRLTSNNITNYFVQEYRRIDLIIPIAYSEDIAKAREVIMTLIKNNDMIIQEKYNRVAVDTLNSSSVDLSVWIWCKSEDYWNCMEQMKESIKNSLDANGITIPFSQLDLHIIDKNAPVKELPQEQQMQIKEREL